MPDLAPAAHRDAAGAPLWWQARIRGAAWSSAPSPGGVRRVRAHRAAPCRRSECPPAMRPRRRGVPRRRSPPRTGHPGARCRGRAESPGATSCRAEIDRSYSELENQREPVAALAAEVVRLGHHGRHLRLPANVDRVGGEIPDGAVVVIALDVVEKVETVAVDQVFRDPDAANSFENVRPDRAVILLVAFLGAGSEPGVEAGLHHAEFPAVSWVRSHRSPLAMCAVATARASSGSPAMIAW